MIKFLSALFLCCMAINSLNAQTPYLEKEVTIRSGIYSYEEVFKQISNQTGVVFSYTGFDDKQRTSVKFEKQPLRIVLNNLFDSGTCTYKLKGKYVIVNCKTAAAKPKQDNSSASNSNVIVNGYIYNAEDSTQVAESSVYLRQNKQSAVTNEYGYFNMSFPKTADVLSISVAKEDFEDTTVVILSQQRNTIVIYLQPKSAPVSVMVNDSMRVTITVDSVRPVETQIQDTIPYVSPFWQKFAERRANLRNISDTLFNDVSFSFVPPLSTNHLLSVNTVNKYSFNVLVGSSKGIDVFELGGLANLDYGNVKCVQVGGLANLVSGTSSGVQVAGIVNTVAQDVNGVQVAGIVNIDGAKVDYVQVAGIANLVQDTVRAVQVGGIANLNNSYTEGVQIAGIYNHSRNVLGTQIAGIANYCDTISGSQISGLVNNASVVNGFQLSGLVNRGGEVNGSQLGFLNIANTVSGVPIGFMSIVKTGYHKVEIATDENLIGTLSFRTGVDAFHNIFIGGVQITEKPSLWTFGYGLGSAIKLSRKWYLDVDLTAQHMYLSNTDFSYNMLAKGFLGVEYRFGNNFSIAAGPTFNWYNTEIPGAESDPIWNKIEQRTVYNDINGNFMNRLWVGGKVAIRFF
jgi:hypothetical protein